MKQTMVQKMAFMACLLLLVAACEQADPPAENGVAEDDRAPSEPDCELTMGWDPWEPYQYQSPRGEVEGLDIELVEAAAGEANCRITFKQSDFVSLVDGIRAGEIDFLPGATRTETREQFAYFTRPYRNEYFTLWVRSGDQELFEESDLQALLEERRRIGFTEGFYYGGEVEALMADPAHEELLHSARIGDLNLLRLIDHEVDAIIEDPYVASSIQRRLGLSEQVVQLDPELGRGEVHLMFSRESVDEDIVERFNQALEQLAEDGTKDKIARRYQGN